MRRFLCVRVETDFSVQLRFRSCPVLDEAPSLAGLHVRSIPSLFLHRWIPQESHLSVVFRVHEKKLISVSSCGYIVVPY